VVSNAGSNSLSTSSRTSAQMRTRSRRAASVFAAAEREPRASLGDVTDRDAAAARIDADQVTHPHVGAERAAHDRVAR